VSARPIRILRLIARLNVGGPALQVTSLTSGLEPRGYETLLVAGRVGEEEGSMEYLAQLNDAEPLYVSELQRNIDPRADVRAARRVLELMREFRPDILHTHTAKAGAIGRTAALLAGADRPKLVVHTFHGHVLRGYFNPVAARAFLQVERALARSTDALIAVSPEVRDDLVELGVAPAKRIAVVRLGLDLDARTSASPDARPRVRKRLGVRDDAFLVGWLGRMTEVKQVDCLLRAFAALRRRGVDAELVLVGDGPLRGQLERLAEELGIHDRCRFVGYIEEVGALYAAFDAVALTSANEGTPVTLIEALAAGVPVVATDVGGVRDVVADGRSGFLVQAADAEGVGAALERLARDPALRARFGETGRASARQRYSVPRLVDDLDTLYRTLLEQPARGPISLTPPIPSALPPSVRTRIAPAPRRLRVHIVSQYFAPEVGATQTRMQAFAEYLTERGHAVTVIAEFPNHPQGVIPERYRGHLIEDDRSNRYRVLRVWVKTSAVKTQRTRLAFYGSFAALATAVGPLAGRADVVLATSPPLFTGLTGVALARASRAPFVLDVRDLWPAAAEALDQISPGWPHLAATALERWLYREAASVVAVTRPFCRHVDRVRARGPSAALIPNGTLEGFFDTNGDGAAARSELGAPDDAFLVTFAGTLGIAQALPSVLAAAELLGGDQVRIALVGDGAVKEGLMHDAERRGLANVHFHAQVPLERMPALLRASDALLVPLSAHPVFAEFVPSKMIDFMAAGRPIVLAASGEAARILERAHAGLAVPPEDPAALADAIRWLASHRGVASEMGDRGRGFARRRLRSTQSERLEAVLFDVVG
jgi:glycosyltransferase involved in cell wall biosynthesis